MSIQNLAGQSLGQYQLKELLGVGGMGAVYRGYQSSLQRDVAVKVMSPELVTQPDYIERFYREARTAASLEHAHIVPVHDYGVQGDISYVVMRLLTGGTLMDRLAQQAETSQKLPSLAETSEILTQLASALDYAHSKDVIHRDIKPSNIMFDNQGSAYLVDFGIAKLLTASRAITSSGVLMGTPLFMPPEQWRAEEVTPATDQYALGVMIYALVTGRVPFEADTPHGLMYKHLNEAPTPPQIYRPETPTEVTQVLRRALAKDPAERFPTVTAFAQAFDKSIRGVEGEKTNFFSAPLRRTRVAPRPAPVALAKTVKDRPARPFTSSPLVWGGAGIVALILLALLFFFLSSEKEGTPQRLVETAAAQTIVALNLTGTASVPTATPSPTLTLTETATATAEAPSLTPQSEVRVVSNTPPSNPPPTRAGLPGFVVPTVTPSVVLPETQVWIDLSATARQWTPTDTATPTATPNYTATYAAYQVVAGQTLTAESWTDTPTMTWTPSATPTFTLTPSVTPTSTPTSTPTATPVPPPVISVANAGQVSEQSWASVFGSINDLAWLPDGKSLVMASSFDIALYDVNNLATPARNLGDDRVFFIDTIAVSPDGATVAFNSSGEISLGLWNTRTGELRSLVGHTGNVKAVAFSPDGTLLASGGDDKSLRLWDVASGQELFFSLDHNNAVSAVAFSPDGTLLASGGADGTVRIWDVQTHQTLFTLQSGAISVDTLAFSPDGTLLASGSYYDNSVHVWNPHTGAAVIVLVGHESGVLSLSFSPDGTLLASGSGDWTVRLWDVQTGQTVATLARHTSNVIAVAFSPDGTCLASASMDAVRLWGVPTGSAASQPSAGTVPTLSVASPTPAPLAAGVVSISAANVAQIQPQASLQIFGSPTDVLLLPDNKTLIVGSFFDILRYDLDQVQAEPVELVDQSTESLALRADGRLLAIGSGIPENMIRLWDLTTGVEVMTLKGHTGNINGLAFSPDGSLLASGSGDSTLRLWDATTGQELFFSSAHRAAVQAVAFSPDGTLLASGGQDGAVRIWDVATRQVLQTLDTGSYSVDTLAFSPDGTLLAAGGSGDNKLRLWNPRTGASVAALYGPAAQDGATAGVYSTAFSPDGKILASGDGEGAVVLWDSDAASPSFGQQLAVLQRHSDWVDSLLFSADGTILISASERDSTVQIWRVPSP